MKRSLMIPLRDGDNLNPSSLEAFLGELLSSAVDPLHALTVIKLLETKYGFSEDFRKLSSTLVASMEDDVLASIYAGIFEFESLLRSGIIVSPETQGKLDSNAHKAFEVARSLSLIAIDIEATKEDRATFVKVLSVLAAMQDNLISSGQAEHSIDLICSWLEKLSKSAGVRDLVLQMLLCLQTDVTRLFFYRTLPMLKEATEVLVNNSKPIEAYLTNPNGPNLTKVRRSLMKLENVPEGEIKNVKMVKSVTLPVKTQVLLRELGSLPSELGKLGVVIQDIINLVNAHKWNKLSKIYNQVVRIQHVDFDIQCRSTVIPPSFELKVVSKATKQVVYQLATYQPEQ